MLFLPPHSVIRVVERERLLTGRKTSFLQTEGRGARNHYHHFLASKVRNFPTNFQNIFRALLLRPLMSKDDKQKYSFPLTDFVKIGTPTEICVKYSNDFIMKI